MGELPIIDIAALFAVERRAQAATDTAIGEAVAAFGGFVIAQYPGAWSIDSDAATLLSFFDLPETSKQGVASRALNPEGKRIYRGYFTTRHPDRWSHNQIYDIGPERPVAGPAIAGMEILAEPNVWPDVEPVPGWRRAMQDFHGRMESVARRLLLSVGRTAGVAETELLSRFDGGNSTLRLLNYPRVAGGPPVHDELPDDRFAAGDDPPLATGRHTDAAGLSLLWQRQPGLQAQAPDGTWRDVPCRANCISVHLGDVLELISGGRVRATPHRVIDLGVHRQSVGFFLEPALSASLAPIRAKGAKADVRGTYGWHLQTRTHQQKGYEHLVPAPALPETAGA